MANRVEKEVKELYRTFRSTFDFNRSPMYSKKIAKLKLPLVPPNYFLFSDNTET